MDDESFEIPVTFKGEQLHFKTYLIVFGYSYKFKVIIDEAEVFFEPDNDGNFRALIDTENVTGHNKTIDIELIRTIAESIQLIIK